jgi:hypothetical protein
MKIKTLTLIATSALALSASAAAAQAWRSIDQRQANLEARIDGGVASGDLTTREARELRQAFRDLAVLESRYESNGLSSWERNDLDQRFDALSSRIRFDRHDGQTRWDDWRGPGGGWMSINDRQDRLDDRIDRGVRNGRLTRREAASLRSEYRAIARLEARYRANGLSNWERADLDRRFDALASRIRWERTDGQRYSSGYRR